MSAVLKLQRSVTDRHVAQLADPDLAAKLAAERAMSDELLAAKDSNTTGARTVVTKDELARLLSVTSRAIELLVKRKAIPCAAILRVGRRIRFDLAATLEALRMNSSSSSVGARGAAWARARA